MHNPLSEKFTSFTLIKFTGPTICMMLFLSMYTMVDGLFVSNFVGENALSAINIVWPAISSINAISLMLATGGGAIVAHSMGRGDYKKAKEDFSLIILVAVVLAIILCTLVKIFDTRLINVLGSTKELDAYCKDYLSYMLPLIPFMFLQMQFQHFFVTAGKPKLGLFTTLIAGIANIVLDYLFIVTLDFGIKGAALGTGLSCSIPAICGIVFFIKNKNGTLSFVKPKWDLKMLASSCFNGSSEMVSSLAMAITTFLYNMVMLELLGADGVAAITIILYAQFLQIAIYLGFSSGISPVFSYNYGNENFCQLKRLFKMSLGFLAIVSIIIFTLSMTFASQLVGVFVSVDSPVFEIARRGFLIFSTSSLIIGFNIFASALFTSFGNGKLSALISFLRTFLFISVSIIVLPKILGIDGVWLSALVAEGLAIIVSGACVLANKYRYKYI